MIKRIAFCCPMEHRKVKYSGYIIIIAHFIAEIRHNGIGFRIYLMQYITLEVLLPDKRLSFIIGLKRQYAHDNPLCFRIYLENTLRRYNRKGNALHKITLQIISQERFGIPRQKVNTVVFFINLFIIKQLVFTRALTDRTDISDKITRLVVKLYRLLRSTHHQVIRTKRYRA